MHRVRKACFANQGKQAFLFVCHFTDTLRIYVKYFASSFYTDFIQTVCALRKAGQF